LIPFAALVLAIGIAPVVAAQDPAPSPQPAAPQAQPPAPEPQAPAMSEHSQKLEGELVSVDPATKMITVKTAAGQEEKIAYTDQTTISGATSDAAGLATVSGAKVTVEYTGEGSARTATTIKVQKPKM
jgi:hypothetical protein